MLRVLALVTLAAALGAAQGQEPGGVGQGGAAQARGSAMPAEAQALRERLAREVAELEMIAEAQGELIEFVHESGTGSEQGLDPVLCAASALSGLCAELPHTFGEGG